MFACCNRTILRQIVVPPSIKALPLKLAYTDLLGIIKLHKDVIYVGVEGKLWGDIQDQTWSHAAVLLALNIAC
jgi:hypothetical protein